MFIAIGVLRLPLPAVLLVAIPLSIAITLACAAGCGMNSGGNPILTLAWTFGLMSLFAVGGANAAIPEMHRVAVDVQHWLSDKQFADVFAISQMSPGPNVLIVTLIGYSVAGVAGALVATHFDVRADRRPRLWRQPPFDAIEPVALAGDHPGRRWCRFRSG